SVHCKLGTRATQNSAYRQRRERVKSNLFSRCVKDAYVVTTPFLRIRLAYRADSLVAMMA
ncbi:MAG TPA: hypothetical protein DCM07_10140, partial [Planctomycetaceae bacterium]|nr:hypothetical protein [Planctomycetaceae bacterium]